MGCSSSTTLKSDEAQVVGHRHHMDHAASSTHTSNSVKEETFLCDAPCEPFPSIPIQQSPAVAATTITATITASGLATAKRKSCPSSFHSNPGNLPAGASVERHFADGRKFLGVYKGQNSWHGAMHYPTTPERHGAVYKGEWWGTKRHGKGTYSVLSDQLFRYEGEWENDKMDGFGSLDLGFCSESYEGDFKADRFHGEGTYHYRNGETFSGSWREGKKHEFKGQAGPSVLERKEKINATESPRLVPLLKPTRGDADDTAGYAESLPHTIAEPEPGVKVVKPIEQGLTQGRGIITPRLPASPVNYLPPGPRSHVVPTASAPAKKSGVLNLFAKTAPRGATLSGSAATTPRYSPEMHCVVCHHENGEAPSDSIASSTSASTTHMHRIVRFRNCGHACCCKQCSQKLVMCPLCRKAIR